jgi:hypothetical protein
MNIRKIIQEEMDDLGWMDNIKPLDLTLPFVVSFSNDELSRLDDTEKVVNYMKQLTELSESDWPDGEAMEYLRNDSNVRDGDGLFLFAEKTKEISWVSNDADMYNKYVRQYEKIYTMEQILQHLDSFNKSINEEMDDFDWVRDTSPLDAKMSFTNIHNLLMNIFRKSDNKNGYMTKLIGQNLYLKDGNGLYDRFDEDDWDNNISLSDIIRALSLSDSYGYSESIKKEYYDLVDYIKNHFDNNINESDDLKWMDDITPLPIGLTRREMVSLLRTIFKNTKYRLESFQKQFTIWDNTGSYRTFMVEHGESISIQDIIDDLTISVNLETLEQSIKDEYSELISTIKNHFNINESDDFQWIEDIDPYNDIFRSGDWLIENDIIEEDPYMEQLQKYLFSIKMSWVNCRECNMGEINKFGTKGYLYMEGMKFSNDTYPKEMEREPLDQFGWIGNESHVANRTEVVDHVLKYSEILPILRTLQ